MFALKTYKLIMKVRTTPSCSLLERLEVIDEGWNVLLTFLLYLLSLLSSFLECPIFMEQMVEFRTYSLGTTFGYQ